MSEATVKMTNGQRWTAQQFVDHYLQTSASGTKSVAVPPEAVPVDMSWYMNDGPGRYYHPGMFPIINQLVKRADLAPGSYDLRDFVPNRNSRDPALTASISHYTTDVSSADYPMRALVFGNESARISGQVGVNQDGTKTFRGIEIRPLDSDFNFDHKTKQPLLEAAREVARRIYDPENQGVSYDIQYRGPGKGPGTGRFYGPFSDGELRAGPGALPSGPIASMPGFNEYLQYLDRVSGKPAPQPQTDGTPPITDAGAVPPLSRGGGTNSPPYGFGPGAPPAFFALPDSLKFQGDIATWLAGIAGIDPRDPTQPAPSPQAGQLGGFYGDGPAQPWSLRRRR